MEEEDLIVLHPDNYAEWSPLMARSLYRHNVLPYAPALEYTLDQVDEFMHIFCRHMDYKIMTKIFKHTSSDPYAFWMYLWEKFGDSSIPPFPQDLLPPVATITSSDEITPPPPVASTDHIPATDASDSVQ